MNHPGLPSSLSRLPLVNVPLEAEASMLLTHERDLVFTGSLTTGSQTIVIGEALRCGRRLRFDPDAEIQLNLSDAALILELWTLRTRRPDHRRVGNWFISASAATDTISILPKLSRGWLRIPVRYRP
jgi:hypothetical protein